ncbi:hypothetical protein HAX54_004357 [Datura stramonium]|uniref:Uncharacterized protein n=1 Tax=Datura stramonium TaxID=4076 RepID=A0ABS8T8D6_DATST|nr:hypothetical protein [Datura stramonium]
MMVALRQPVAPLVAEPSEGPSSSRSRLSWRYFVYGTSQYYGTRVGRRLEVEMFPLRLGSIFQRPSWIIICPGKFDRPGYMPVRVHRFIMGMNPKYVETCITATLQKDMDIAPVQAFAHSIERIRQRQREIERAN